MTRAPEPMPHLYRMSGLVVASEVELPGAIALTGPAEIDVRLRIGEVSPGLAAPRLSGPDWWLDGRDFLMDLPEIGRFLARDGREIVVDPAPGQSIPDVLPFAVGTTFGALLHQRGALLLHASAVTRGGRAHLMCGHSGIGKSTLAAALVGAGCGFLGDDVAAVEVRDDGEVVVHPDGRMLRLYRDSIARTGLGEAVGPALRSKVDKYFVTPPTAVETAAPLASVQVLEAASATQPVGIRRLSPVTAAQSLLRHAYRRRLALASGVDLAARTATLLARVPVNQLVRPADLARIDETVAMLIARWDAAEG